MRNIVVVTLLVSVASFGFSSSARADGDVFAVLPTQGTGGVTSEAEMAGNLMRIALQEQSLALVPADTVRSAAVVHEAACLQSPVACARLVGAAVGASKVIASELWDQAGALELRLVVVDLRAGSESAWQSFQAKDKAALGPVAQQAVLSLVVPQAFFGTVGITMLPGAEILVDGIARDRTPLVAPLKLAVGRHELEVRYGTAAPWRGYVEVAMEKTHAVRLCVKAEAVVDDCGDEKGPRSNALFLGSAVGAGVGVASVVSGGVLALLAASSLSAYGNSADVEDKNNATTFQTISVVTFGVGGILVAAGGAGAAASMWLE